MHDDPEMVDQVREVMATTFGMDESELQGDVNQETCTRWTSLYHMTLLLVLEEHFNTSFTTEEMPEMTSLSKIVSALKRHGIGVPS